MSVIRTRDDRSCNARASASARETRRLTWHSAAGRRPASMWRTNVRREQPQMCAASSSVTPSTGLMLSDGSGSGGS